MSLTEILPAVKQLPTLDKIRLIRILAEELDTDKEIFPFQPYKIYYLLTPYNAFGVARALMDAMKTTDYKFVVCVDNSAYPASLELRKIYRALPDADAAREGDIRVIDESGEAYLFPAKFFIVVELPRDVEHALLETA